MFRKNIFVLKLEEKCLKPLLWIFKDFQNNYTDFGDLSNYSYVYVFLLEQYLLHEDNLYITYINWK